MPETRWTVTVDADGNLRGIGDKTASVPPTVAARSGLRVIEVMEAPSLPVGGDDGRAPAEVFLVWGVNYPRGDEEFTLLSVHADRDEAAAVVDGCDWRGERQVAVALPEWADVAFDSVQGPDARPVLGASSSAGDEARDPSPDGGERGALRGLVEAIDTYDRFAARAGDWPDKRSDVIAAARVLRNAVRAGEGQDAPAREEWRVIDADGELRGFNPGELTSEQHGRWYVDGRRGMRLQRRTVTEWVDVPAEEGGAR